MEAIIGSEIREVQTGEFGEERGTALFYWVEVLDLPNGVVYYHDRMFRTDDGVDRTPALCAKLRRMVEAALADGTLTRDHMERSPRWLVGEPTYRHKSFSLGETEAETRHFERELREGLREAVNPFPW